MKKRGLSLFLALALCLTLLPAAAFANGESETSTLHTYYLCGNGQACSHVGGHSEDSKTTFATAITQTESGYVYVGDGTQDQPYQCVLSEGTYYLDSDLVLKGPPNLKKFGCICIDSDVTLCLNGHTITIIDDRDAFDIRKSVESNPPTLTLTDCKNSGQITHDSSFLGNGVSLHQSCNFIMYGGSITGNTTSGGENTTWRSGGVHIGSDSAFTMTGGSITDNTTVWNGGGVYVGDSGKFYMHGGEISGNNASSNSGSSGGGVHIGSGSAFTMTGGSITGNNAGNGGGGYVGSDVGYGNSILTLSGAVQIKDNVCNGTKGSNGNYSGGTTSNVYLRSGKTITVDTNHLSSNASIGVTTQNLPANEGIAIATGANLNDKQYFHSDTGENYLFYVTSGGTICMTAANAHGHPICGASCSHNGSSHTSETWQPIGSAEELTAIRNGGCYYLADDVTLSNRSVWEPPSDTFLCLNGHTITGAAGKNTIDVGSDRSFTLTDCQGSGKITHENSNAVGCGVKVIGSFTMYSGSITGNQNYDGGGVRVEDTGSFTMYGGSITGNSVSGSGGGSSSGRPSTSTGKTDTTTTTKPDGTVTEITTNKDGSTTKTETKPDGSSKTEVKNASGSTGTVKTDKNGQTTAETTLSSKAVEDAKKNGEAVKAPVEVEASRDSNTAPTVKVELPKNAGETEVEIPVSNVKPGTVAVLVHPDGTEEIVKNSLPTEDGIWLTMDGSATVKIMDNSKDFIDTRAHWAKDAIDFVSARGLVNGISDTIYAPNNSATRAQLWTILARQNDADLTGGSIWYEKAQNWAKDKGVSDGANPNAAINRAQMVTMLWRAMGQPAAASGASFADVPADSYYAQAVAWAIENGITAGVGNGKFDPDAACTRGQIATFLYRYIQHVCSDAQSGRSHCSI